MKDVTRKPNAERLLEYLLKHGKVGEPMPLSVKQMDDLVFTKPVKQAPKLVEYTPIVATRLRLLHHLEYLEVIKLDYTDKWNPKITVLKNEL